MEVEVIELTGSFKLYRVGFVNYYVYSGEKTVLIETGLSCTASKLLEELDEDVDSILITHAHFDHITGLSVLLEQYPEAEVAGHASIARLLEKEKVLKSWFKDDAEVCGESYDGEKLRIDRGLGEGDVFHGLEIYEVPGHSPDSLAVYHRGENVLLVSDSLGYFTSSGKVIPLFFYSYDQYLSSIDRLAGFRPEILGVGHVKYFTGRECDHAVRRAREEAVRLAEMVKSGMEDEKLLEYFIVDELKFYPKEAMKASAMLLKRRVLESD
ncbi:MBL fold metallo-hydrolase [Geoglobus ahangari]